MAERAPLPRMGEKFWAKSLDEKKATFDSLHPDDHRTFFNRLGGSVRGTKDEAVRTARQGEVEALREHQTRRAGESMGALFSPAQDASPAPQEGTSQPVRGGPGIQGALTSGQPVGVHHPDANGHMIMRAVAPGNLQNYLESIPKSASVVHITHRLASDTSYNHEPAHTTVLKRSQKGNWAEDPSQSIVHPASTVRPSAPFVTFGLEEQRRRTNTESQRATALGNAEAALEPPSLPLGLHETEDQGLAQRTHRQLMRKAAKGDPFGQQYAAQFTELAQKHAAQTDAVAKAAQGLRIATGRTAQFQKGQMAVRGAPGAVVPDEYKTEGERGTEGMHIENAGDTTGVPTTIPKAQQGTVWSRPLTEEDHAVNDVLRLTGAVTHSDHQHLLNATPNMPEFNQAEVPDGLDADEQHTHALNLGVRDAKNSVHVQGMLADIQGTADHPEQINGFTVHHYISKVAAEAGVDTNAGILSHIANNARSVLSQRQQGFIMGEGIGVSARTHMSQGGTPGVTRPRSHAQLQVEPGSGQERSYREGLKRTGEAALAEYHHHLARSDQGFVQSSGDEIWQDTLEAAKRGEVTLRGDNQAKVQGPNYRVPMPVDEDTGEQHKEDWEGTAASHSTDRAKKQSEGIKGIKAEQGENKSLEEQTNAYLENPPPEALERAKKAEAERAAAAAPARKAKRGKRAA